MDAQKVTHTKHAECKEGEVFIGNMTRRAMSALTYESKRDGQICYCEDGRMLSQGGTFPEQRLVPVFVSKEEYEAHIGH